MTQAGNVDRVGQLFEQALDVPLAQRVAWLDQHCADDAPLRAKIDALLRADARLGDFLERPPELVMGAIGAAVGAGPPRFGAWQALRSIGIGGMGEVWLALRSDGEFEQRAAIKQLAYPTPGLLQRFRQERQILARLEHPNIARLIDGGVDAQGSPYLVMEFVDGRPITTYADAENLDLRARLQLFLRVCGAVQFAHQNLIVHRDLKPSNIFVTGEGDPKLLDFGIAKVLATTEDVQTQTAARLLTPDYAAPEQFSGGAITTSTDVYALGVVLYELMAGARPQRAGRITGAVQAGLDSTDPLAPSVTAGRIGGKSSARRRALRGDLDRIALTALAADPRRRYASVEALAADIQHYLEGRPITARRDSTWYRTTKFVQRNRLMLAAATIVFAACIGAAVISVHQAQLARAQSQRASAVRQFMAGVFAQSNPDENRGQPITAHQLLEKGEQQLAREHGAHPDIESDVTALLARLYRDIGDHEHAWHMVQKALAVISDPRIPDDVRARILLAAASAEAEDKDAFDDAMQHTRQALLLLDAAGDKDWEAIADAHRVLGLCLIRRSENQAAVTLLLRNIPRQRSELGNNSLALADEYVLLGVALGGLARFDEAESAFNEGAGMLRDISGPQSNRYAYALNEFGQMIYAKGDIPRAEALHRQVLQIHLSTLGPDHHDTLTARHNLLGVLEAEGDYAQALPQRLAMIEATKTSTQLTPTEIAFEFDGAANDYRELGRFTEAEATSREAIAKIVAAQGPRSPRSIVATRHLGLALSLQGKPDEAEALFRDALSIALEHDTSTSLMACGLRRDIGQALRQQHRSAEAVEQLHALTEDRCMIGLSETDAWRPAALADLSLAQLDHGDAALAYATAQQAIAYGRKAMHGRFILRLPLFALGRAALEMEHPDEAESALREALAVSSPPYPATDPRILEVQVALIRTLRAARKIDEALKLTTSVESVLATQTSPYAKELRATLLTTAP